MYTQVRNEECFICKGDGKVPMKHHVAFETCFSCGGCGYKIIYQNDKGIERNVSLEDHELGVIAPYFNMCRD